MVRGYVFALRGPPRDSGVGGTKGLKLPLWVYIERDALGIAWRGRRSAFSVGEGA